MDLDSRRVFQKTTSMKRVWPMCKHWKAQTWKKRTRANPPSRKSKSLVHPEEQQAGQEGISRSTKDKILVSLFLKEHEDDDVEPNETVTFALISYSYCRLPASIGAKNGRRQAFIRPPTVVTFPHPWGPLEAPFSIDWCVWFAQSFGSLSLGKGRYLSTFGGVAEILAKF